MTTREERVQKEADLNRAFGFVISKVQEVRNATTRADRLTAVDELTDLLPNLKRVFIGFEDRVPFQVERLEAWMEDQRQ